MNTTSRTRVPNLPDFHDLDAVLARLDQVQLDTAWLADSTAALLPLLDSVSAGLAEVVEEVSKSGGGAAPEPPRNQGGKPKSRP